MLENTATADSTQTDEDTDDATVPVDQNPALNITKTADAGQVADLAGEQITYTITVENEGNQTLTGVVVTDPFADAGSITLVADAASADGELDVGETWSYTAAHTVTQAEIDSNGGGDGLLENTATADSTQTDEDTDDATVPVDQNPALNITKTADAGQVADLAGEQITYIITVENSTQTDEDTDDATVPLDLGPGERTPGFWAQKNWQKFWDGVEGNEPKQSGTEGFPDGEITVELDSGKKGLLIGDFNGDGSGLGEDTLFISTQDALSLLNPSEKESGDARFVLGRDLVASWLNYLAGNSIGDTNDPDANTDSVAHYIDDSVEWLLLTADTNDDGTLSINGASGELTAATAVPQSSPVWQEPLPPIDHAAAALHSGLDFYNNNGFIV